ncbi:hypothetical protein D3227_15050 [Mesorhizobium waimense]|uniref:DUF680 domain-containing protein n=1 Tax=Mesorhizobium waimense TaxID=1300307 RepID=A0A3A5KZR3_9HYPH|nr:DUF680 domain-containing protein [Mesorhizobium waimense]RJT39009.1 hypothetical protein D3227_15050 [Mesorhizobium waimense]
MMKIVLTTATFLFASGMAFAGSDNYGTDYIPGAGSYPNAGHHSMKSEGAYSVDLSSTASIGTADSAVAQKGNSSFDIPAPGYGQGIWGR